MELKAGKKRERERDLCTHSSCSFGISVKSLFSLLRRCANRRRLKLKFPFQKRGFSFFLFRKVNKLLTQQSFSWKYILCTSTKSTFKVNKEVLYEWEGECLYLDVERVNIYSTILHLSLSKLSDISNEVWKKCKYHLNSKTNITGFGEESLVGAK